jgi:N-acetyltransferase
MAFLEPLVLKGEHASLVPLSQSHHDDLVAAVHDGELWNLWYTSVPSPQAMGAEIERRLGHQVRGVMLAFTVLDAEGRVVGMTGYINADAQNRRVEIGSTWYRKSMQRTALNTECKLLLLSHAFETLHCIAVEFRTHFLNAQSRRGIERLGAKFDGLLRSHSIMANGTIRDTAVYSIIAGEWPAVKCHLRWQLAKPR